VEIECRAPACRCITPCDGPDDWPELSPREEQVYDALRYSEARGTRRITDDCTGLSTTTVYRLLRKLSRYGVAEQVGKWRWRRIR